MIQLRISSKMQGTTRTKMTTPKARMAVGQNEVGTRDLGVQFQSIRREGKGMFAHWVD